MSKFTPGKLESVGSTRLWTTDPKGGAVCIIAEPRCRTSGDFKEVGRGSKRFNEAMANAARLAHCWNCHDELLEALQALPLDKFANEDSLDAADFVDHSKDFLNAMRLARAALAKATGKEPQ